MNQKFDYAALGARIRKCRKEKNMTQEQLAEACDLSTAHIGHIERGTRALSVESLITLSHVLEISTDYLLMDVYKSDDKQLSSIINTIGKSNRGMYESIYTVLKILADNTDKF